MLEGVAERPSKPPPSGVAVEHPTAPRAPFGAENDGSPEAYASGLPRNKTWLGDLALNFVMLDVVAHELVAGGDANG